MSEAKEYLKRVGLLQSPYISQERVIKHLEAFANERIEAITVTRCCKSDSDVVADIRNKLGSVTALIDLIKLRKTEHADYAESKLDTQILKAIESIQYIKQL